MFNEKTTGYINLAFTDEDGDAVVPDSATYTLYNEATEAIINSREAVSISSPTASYDLELIPADNAIVDANKHQEAHILMVEWIYNTDKYDKKEHRFLVQNLKKVS